jgi:hypothetical protein
MSKGPGRIERAILAVFAANPSMTFTVDDLTAIAYPGLDRVEKKHRVAVARAARKVAPPAWWGWRWMEQPGHRAVYFNLLDHRSYVIGRMRASYNLWNFSHAEISEAIDNPDIDRSGAERWRKEAQPGSAYWVHVEINRAAHASDHDRANTHRDEFNASINRRAAALRTRI